MPGLPALLSSDEFLIHDVNSGRAAPPGAASGSDGGTGPFQVSQSAGGVLTLAANEASWQGRPFVDAIEVRGHRAVSDQWMDLAAGRADIVEVPPGEMRQAQQQHLAPAISDPVEVLVLEVSTSGALANPNLRSAIAWSIDRNVLANVIFQRQGQPSAALLPQKVSGYAFLFPPQRDMNKAHELRGGLAAPALSLAAPASGAYQLAAQRIALNLREAGFNVQVVPEMAINADLVLRSFPITGADPAADLEQMLRAAGEAPPALGHDYAAVYRAEREILDRRILIPLLHLPRAYATADRVRDFHLRFDGTPDLDDISLEAAP
jgi:MarR-like DNA-binding transcriptional regulator SgrR of sgrS sRNA